MPMSVSISASSRCQQACAPRKHLTARQGHFVQPFRSHLTRSLHMHATSINSSVPDEKLREQLDSLNSVVSDEAVPEGHKGLHGFLYGEQGAEQHDGSGRRYEFRRGEDEGSTILPVQVYLSSREDERPMGVYALYDSSHNIQYVGYSRNMVLSVKGHLSRVGEERCAFVRSMVFMNKAMASKSALEQQVENWINEFGTLPPGNGVEKNVWEGRGVNTSVMTAAELAEYEEKKLKMRKAMGENLNDAVAGETIDSKQRRLNLMRAVEGDDWSVVIDGQTQHTVAPPMASSSQPAPPSEQRGPSNAESASTQPVVSPFSQANVHRAIGDDTQQDVEMTVENVDEALNEVRPYLQADGGDVEVVGVQDGTVLLRLQGACGTCPSSSATMRMGIERSLRARFGDKLRDVVQVDKQDLGSSVEAVDGHLNILRGAIQNYGGKVEVVSVDNGTCQLRYKGPKPIQMGVQAAIKDRFPDVRQVQFLEFDE